MDPVSPLTAAGAAVAAYLVRLGYLWIRAYAEVRRTALTQQGLLDRIRSLPPGSRLTERSADRHVDVVVGAAAFKHDEGS
ncbi:hypothetical protein OOK31_32865 [Streptomyces sp. NBC_00249]|uniref:hypothetical protein n=1 Tax=Streptomyces sp. NBC_00249 TaxID=2975690 RepID=UPI002254BAB7|nr:hypothetical protein [Streptomyces sp. NBC_00249]MCX5198625.1 hypothetical protein [Streptomyces sp. NBC_00249]